MSLEARIEALKEKHAVLEMKIDEENSRPMPDDALVHTMKREKLNLKDEIERGMKLMGVTKVDQLTRDRLRSRSMC